MTGGFIDIPARDGGTFQGYLALPEGGRGPGSDDPAGNLRRERGHPRDQRLLRRKRGYVVLAPDMFHRLEKRVELGYSDAEFATAFGYFEQFDFAKAVARTWAPRSDRLKGMGRGRRPGARAAPPQVATLGYCLGGALAAYQAAAHCGVDAAASYYGVRIEDQLHLKRTGSPARW